jgi:hypothetical protein
MTPFVDCPVRQWNNSAKETFRKPETIMRHLVKPLAALLCLPSLIIAQPVKAETAQLKNPNWQEVPGTLDPKAPEEFRSAVFIDLNGITKRKTIFTFDLINTDTSYVRLETNCQTQLFRAVRQGQFDSKTQISYTPTVQAWSKPTSTNQIAIVKYICNLPKSRSHLQKQS